MKPTTMIAAVLLYAAIASGQQAERGKEPPATTHATEANAKPDPVVAAVRRSAEMHDQAAQAAQAAVDKVNHGGPLSQAQRHLLLAAALLYNSSDQLKRIAQKEAMRGEQRQALGEQKASAAKDLDEEAEKTEAQRQAKAYVAYGTTQSTIAEAIAALASRQEELAKEADAAGKATASEPLEKSAKNIIAENAAAKRLPGEVREMRAKLEKLGK